MKKFLTTFIFVLTFGIALCSPAVLLAAEHGGTEVAGSEHGGTAMMEGSHGHMAENLSAIKEAAGLLKATHPELAAKLEKIANEEAMEK